MTAGGPSNDTQGTRNFAFPTKRVGSGVLLRDPQGSVLLVKPTYKPGWEIPGGLAESGESPRETAVRECQEELGLTIDVGPLLCVHYSQSGRGSDDGVMFVFDGGTAHIDADEFALPAAELSEARFVSPGRLGAHLPTVMVSRVLASIEAAHDHQIRYLER